MSDGQVVRELARWTEFAEGHLPPTTAVARSAALFNARWRLAWHFQELTAPGYSAKVLDGYSAAFKVFLAYTAHEQLALTTGVPHWEFPFDEDPLLAAEIRKHLEGIRASTLRGAHGKQKHGLTAFWEGRSDNIRFVAFAIRNEVAHGPFTASKLRSKASHALLGRLARRVLLGDEQWFGEWLDVMQEENGRLGPHGI